MATRKKVLHTEYIRLYDLLDAAIDGDTMVDVYNAVDAEFGGGAYITLVPKNKVIPAIKTVMKDTRDDHPDYVALRNSLATVEALRDAVLIDLESD